MMETNPVLEIKHISKTFPGVKALNQVDFSLYPGEVHIIAGENGAGKSTLVKCILGIESIDEGEIYYKGNKVSFSSPWESREAGIVAVHQELTMIPYLDAARNIFFQREPMIPKTAIINEKKLYADAMSIMRELHSEQLPLHTPVRNLGIASQQMIEIAKALSVHSDLLIFDEPTAALTQREVNFLFERIHELKKKGIGIIYISHRMSEFEKIGDRVTVLRDGKWIHTDDIHRITQQELTTYMTGRQISLAQEHISCKIDEEVLRVEHLSDKFGKVRDCSLQIHRGEIVGLSGLVGAGRTELARLIYGVDKASSGKIIFKGRDVTGYSPKKMAELGMGFLPEDRKELGLALRAPISWNIIAASLHKYFPSGLLSIQKNHELAEKYIEDLDIATPSDLKNVVELSGGNQQKVVIAKWLAADTDLIIFDEPTRGVDIGAKIEIYQLIHRLASEGKGILVISSEMEEIYRLCDQIYCMNQGSVTHKFERDSCSIEEIGRSLLEETHYHKESQYSDKNNNKSGDILREFRLPSVPPAFYMMILLILFFGLQTENYFTFSNFSSIFTQAAPLLAVACGQTLVVLIQGTDLSLGSMMSLSCVLWIYLLNMGFPMAVSIAICILAGIIMGSFNGIVSAKGLLPVFIVTLGTQNIFKSGALLLSGNSTLYFSTDLFRTIGKGKFLGLTWSVWIAIVCFLITMVLLRKTRFGSTVKALGGNIEALRYMGTDIAGSQIKVFVYAGFMAVIGGILLCCRIESGNPNAGNGMEFNAIAAVLLGGTSMREGRGGVEGSIFGVLLIQILKSGLMQLGISSIYQNAIIGIVVLSAIVVDAVFKKREEATQKNVKQSKKKIYF